MSTLKTWIRPLKLVAIAVVFSVFVLVNATPAFAFGGSNSKPSDGAESLSQVRKESEKVANSQPRSMKEVQAKAQGGLNAVQGSADQDKMVQPSDTDATSVKDDIEAGIKDILGKS